MSQAFPLHWPEGWTRTATHLREHGYQFRQGAIEPGKYGRSLATFAVARDKLFDELRRLGATNPVVSTNHPTDRYGVPTESKRRIADEGVAVYFTMRGRPMVMACDRFDTAAANMRSLGLAIEALRQLDRHGGGTMLERACTGFVALPSNSPWDVLGLKPGASRGEIEAAYRERAKTAHPDAGGSHDQMARLNSAKAEALGQKP